jgi:hypothetical protein
VPCHLAGAWRIPPADLALFGLFDDDDTIVPGLKFENLKPDDAGDVSDFASCR